ncbi:MAG: M20/M25/M40 family metallo-hydrolase, partial [Anaerolineae bacterium]|nr:M20/M25/M40 family metallo-hydrolase [Anaerolineae bacterium]
IALGKGPAIKVMDARFLSSPEVIALMERAAKAAKVPCQKEILTGGTTDASAIQLARAGVRSGCLSIPCRYVHSPNETVSLSDLQNGARLLLAALTEPAL